MIWYWPEPSVTADRVFSISAGLAISTVTPGSTAPDVSLATPAIVACWARAVAGSRGRHMNAPANMASARFILPPEGLIRTGSDGADATPVQRVLQQLFRCRAAPAGPLQASYSLPAWTDTGIPLGGDCVE